MGRRRSSEASAPTPPVSRRACAAPAALLFAALAGSLAAGCSTSPRPAPDPRPDTPPRLVLVISVDQLIPSRLDPTLPGGLGRLAREGRVFAEAAHAHAGTETCPGHVVMLTGLQPGRAGIPGNRFIVNGTRDVRYCVQDDAADGRLLTLSNEVDPGVLDARVSMPGGGRSPRQIGGDALGDWMKARWPRARVFSVSGKDRAAIALGGQHPDAAYWLDRSGSGSFTTSAYYLDALPEWVAAWTRARVLEGLPATWSYGGVTFGPEIRQDDYEYESPRFSRTAPHPLIDPDAAAQSVSALEASPYLDDRTLAFTQELIEREELGLDDVPDLLAVSFSATDLVGHHYGPYSQEAWASLAALDADIGRLLEELEARTGPGGLLVVLSSDHGVLPIPEWRQSHDDAGPTCPVEGGRVDPTPIDGALSAALVEAFGADWSKGWVRDGLSVGFDSQLGERDGVTTEMAIAVSRTALEGFDAVTRTWTRAEIEAAVADGDDAGPGEPGARTSMARLYHNQLAEGRGGDLFIEPAAGCLLTSWPSGTSHGSPHAYDLDVPLVFWGAGVEPGRIPGRAAPVDIAPTLADWIGLERPAGLDGRVLPLAPAR